MRFTCTEPTHWPLLHVHREQIVATKFALANTLIQVKMTNGTPIVPIDITECCLWTESSIQKSQSFLTPEVSDNYNKNHASQYHYYDNYTTSYSFMMVKCPCLHVSTDGKCFSIMSLPACSNNNYFCVKALNMKTM